MLLSAAYALVPDLVVRTRDPTAEHAALASIALWSEQFTPTLSLVPPSAVLLEIGGSMRYFGGLARLRERLASGIADLGYRCAPAFAPTPTGGLLLARSGSAAPVLTADALPAALARLPLALLDCDIATIDALAAMGVHSFGDCLRLPRDGLARRFGQPLVDEIDRALGRRPDPRPPFIAPAQYRGQLELPAPVAEVDALAFALKRLVGELCGWLLGRGLGTMRMRLDLSHDLRRDRSAATTIVIRLSSPSRSPDHLLAVWRERLARLVLVDRVGGLVLLTEETASLASRNRGLLPGDDAAASEGSSLVDRLRARLGDEAIVRVEPHADHRPERAWRTGELDSPAASPGSGAPAPRPSWLLPEPERLGRVFESDRPWVLMDGPERIESGWWEGGDVRRDYYIARSPRGEVCWIYRDPRYEGEWFLHGVFG